MSLNLKDTTLLDRMRHGLMAVLLIGMTGIGIELFLLEHTEGYWQLVPIYALAAGIVLGAIVWVLPRRGMMRVFQALMLTFVVAGIWGTWLHYRGNVAFELEMSPAVRGWELFKLAMMGATPALAPGTMSQLGLLGLLFTYRHPVLGKEIP